MHIQSQSSNKLYSLLFRLFIYFSIFSVLLESFSNLRNKIDPIFFAGYMFIFAIWDVKQFIEN